jgi:addiction module RelE/StbE family toxin
MRKIEITGQFKKDYKREIKGRYKQTLEQDLKCVFELLVLDIELPQRLRDHPMLGEWKDYKVNFPSDPIISSKLIDHFKKDNIQCEGFTYITKSFSSPLGNTYFLISFHFIIKIFLILGNKIIKKQNMLNKINIMYNPLNIRGLYIILLR